MSHYTGPKAKINRRLGMVIFENAGAIRAFERRKRPPGMAARRRKVSEYGLALMEKQKIKLYYGMNERQFKRLFNRATRMKGNTGENLMMLCERRVDNVICRGGLASTRPQARQGVTHTHFQLNGRTMNVPSIQVYSGDVIAVRNRENLQKFYRELVERTDIKPPEWLTFNSEKLEITVSALPAYEDVSLPVEIDRVVALMTR
ncbi:MAG: 30S ribosomal protein S4 [wastewater metagenome]|nr:30S ribosomal protein S4 [Candidatus Loosdrechtia aerotolerans]